MLQITHKTTDYTIQSSTVQELRDVLHTTVYGVSFKYAKKDELVEAAKGLRDKRVAEQQAIEAEAEKVKQARIEFEKGLPNAAAACKLISEAFESEVSNAHQINANFIERATKYGPADAVKWMMEEAFVAFETLREFGGWAKHFEKQAVEPFKTIVEVQETLEEAAQRYTETALTVSMYPTNVVQSLEQVAKHKVAARMAKMMQRAAKYYRTVAESTDSEQLHKLTRLSFCL